MEKYIVKVRSYLREECIEYGTGIMIGRNLVLTPRHVTCGERHTVWVGGKEEESCVVNENNVAVVLEIGNSDDSYCIADIFSDDEVLDEESRWSVSGFITSQQCEHHVRGTGIIISPVKDEEWDYHLAAITAGIADNYQGLSGSPVFCDHRIVGILQMQAYNSSGALGVRMSSVEMFQDLLAKENFKPNAYHMLLKEACVQYTRSQIDKNVKSKKYIADILVEEGDYKENLRYFADPMLFLKKAIRDAKMLDFKNVNFYLGKQGKQEIDFSDLTENFSVTELEPLHSCLGDRVSDGISLLAELDKYFYSDTSSLEESYDLRQNSLNNSVKYYLSDIKDNIDFIEKKYILLTKDAGQGKTNFVCDFTANFLMRKGYCALYFNAYDFRENPMALLKQKLSLDGVYSFSYGIKFSAGNGIVPRSPSSSSSMV